MHVDSWWDSYLEHGGTQNLCVYIYIYSDVHRFEHQVWKVFII